MINPSAEPTSLDASICTLKYHPRGTSIVCPSARTLSFPEVLYSGKAKLMPLYKNFEGGSDCAGYPDPYPSKLESFGLMENPRLLYRSETFNCIEAQELVKSS